MNGERVKTDAIHKQAIQGRGTIAQQLVAKLLLLATDRFLRQQIGACDEIKLKLAGVFDCAAEGIHKFRMFVQRLLKFGENGFVALHRTVKDPFQLGWILVERHYGFALIFSPIERTAFSPEVVPLVGSSRVDRLARQHMLIACRQIIGLAVEE